MPLMQVMKKRYHPWKTKLEALVFLRFVLLL